MAAVANRVERGRYLDSVTLMRISRRAAGFAGVQAAALMIGTPSNKDLLRGAGLLAAEGEQAGASDLVIALRAASEAEAAGALDAAAALLAEAGAPARGEAALARARSLAGGLALLPQANLALVSVPGEFAALEARRALESGLHVLVFSDNVPIAEERSLKRLASERGLLMMGPDCGSALIAGTPLGFANAVPRGDIGLVSASGTGLQEVSTLIARAGGGISHAIGVGGRDLDEQVGALGALAALAALERDAATRRIVLISKPPAPALAERVLERIAHSAKPYLVCFLGRSELALPANAQAARTLLEAAELALGRPVAAPPTPPARPTARAGGRWVRGFFCGGTLCAEAQLVFLRHGLAVRSNAPVPGAAGPGAGAAHSLLDLGDEEYTRGRPHPMLEPELRNDHVRAALDDPAVAAVLVDVVIGFGAHEDPAGVLVQALARAGAARPAVIASVTGTERDPQGYSRQVAKLRAAGVVVAPSNAHAAEIAASIARG